MPDLAAAQRILRTTFGFEAFRAGQGEIIAAGPGLGEAGLVFDRRSGKYKSFASEGGHCDFAAPFFPPNPGR
jgi:glucokinase